MKPQTVFLWTGGRPDGAKDCEGKVDALPPLTPPTPLWPSAFIEYWWGETKFEILAHACSIRSTPWGTETVTWLHCKAIQTTAVKPDGNGATISVLIPNHYVTRIEPGPEFQIARTRHSGDLGVFPPNQPTPPGALSLAEIERVIAQLLTPERN